MGESELITKDQGGANLEWAGLSSLPSGRKGAGKRTWRWLSFRKTSHGSCTLHSGHESSTDVKTEQGIRTLSCSYPHQSSTLVTAELREPGCWLAKQRGTHVSCSFIHYACLRQKPRFSSKSLNASEKTGASRWAQGRPRSKHHRTHMHTGTDHFEHLNTCVAGSRTPALQRPPGITWESLGGVNT